MYFVDQCLVPYSSFAAQQKSWAWSKDTSAQWIKPSHFVSFKELALQEETRADHFTFLALFFLFRCGRLPPFHTFGILTSQSSFLTQERCKPGKGTFLPLLQTSANANEWLIKAGILNVDHLCSYEMLKGFLPLNRKRERWQLVCLGVIQFPSEEINVYATVLLLLNYHLKYIQHSASIHHSACAQVNANFVIS